MEKRKRNAPDWWQKPANLNKAEYLELLFTLLLHQHADPIKGPIKNVVHFWPSYTASSSLLFVMQQWNNLQCNRFFGFLKLTRLSGRKFEESIISWSTKWLDIFDGFCAWPQVSERWPISEPRKHLMLRHVLPSDDNSIRTIAVRYIGSNGEKNNDPLLPIIYRNAATGFFLVQKALQYTV